MSSSALWTLSHSYYIVIIMHQRRVSVWYHVCRRSFGRSDRTEIVIIIELSTSHFILKVCRCRRPGRRAFDVNAQSPSVYEKKNFQRVKNYRYCCWRRTTTRPQKLLLACTINIIEFCFCRSCIFPTRFSSPSKTAWQPLLSAYTVAFAPICAGSQPVYFYINTL